MVSSATTTCSKGRVARALAKAVDRDARRRRARLKRRDGVGRCKSEVVMAVKFDGKIGQFAGPSRWRRASKPDR